MIDITQYNNLSLKNTKNLALPLELLNFNLNINDFKLLSIIYNDKNIKTYITYKDIMKLFNVSKQHAYNIINRFQKQYFTNKFPYLTFYKLLNYKVIFVEKDENFREIFSKGFIKLKNFYKIKNIKIKEFRSIVSIMNTYNTIKSNIKKSSFNKKFSRSEFTNLLNSKNIKNANYYFNHFLKNKINEFFDVNVKAKTKKIGNYIHSINIKFSSFSNNDNVNSNTTISSKQIKKVDVVGVIKSKLLNKDKIQSTYSFMANIDTLKDYLINNYNNKLFIVFNKKTKTGIAIKDKVFKEITLDENNKIKFSKDLEKNDLYDFLDKFHYMLQKNEKNLLTIKNKNTIILDL